MVLPAAASDIALAVIAFGIVLIPAIIIHELGHFFAAKLVGINVLEFGIGFPPRVRRLFTWGETEFTLNALPIGGFVRPLGEDMIGPAAEDKVKRDRVTLERRRSGYVRIVTEREMLRLRGVDEQKMMSVNEAPALGRIFFMAAGSLANFRDRRPAVRRCRLDRLVASGRRPQPGRRPFRTAPSSTIRMLSLETSSKGSMAPASRISRAFTTLSLHMPVRRLNSR